MSEKVLLVDDEQDFLEALATRMKDRGMDVSTTTSAADALKKVEAGTYDAVVLDLNMPEMDGLEVLKAMKEKRPELQIILLTGYATVQKGVEAMKFGALEQTERWVASVITERQQSPRSVFKKGSSQRWTMGSPLVTESVRGSTP